MSVLEKKELKRKFELESGGSTIILDDPNPEMEVFEVLDFYSSTYPELMNATHEKIVTEDGIFYKLKSIAGSKG